MIKKYSRICARVDLDAIEYNVEMMKRNLQDGVGMIAVLKMDGYGHGAAPIARLLESKDYIWGYAVATCEEAMLLRSHHLEKPILILGCVFPEQVDEMIEHDVRITVYTKQMAEELSEAAGRLGKKAYVHIKLDTGMSRLGFMVNEKSAETIEEISKMPHLMMEGMFTHFSKADERDKTYANKQFEDYMFMKRALEERGVRFEHYHCCNSAGIIDMKEADLTLVRAGISTYGLYPSEEVHKENVPLKPAMELISHVAHVKWVEPGTPISYGGTYITDKRTKIVTVPVGYGDGYSRSLSNKGYVLIHGQKAKILGRVCMDQMMVDGTEIPQVSFGDKVTLIGNDGEEKLPVEILSNISDRFNYEFMCAIGKRVPRTFLRHGKVVKQLDYFR